MLAQFLGVRVGGFGAWICVCRIGEWGMWMYDIFGGHQSSITSTRTRCDVNWWPACQVHKTPKKKNPGGEYSSLLLLYTALYISRKLGKLSFFDGASLVDLTLVRYIRRTRITKSTDKAVSDIQGRFAHIDRLRWVLCDGQAWKLRMWKCVSSSKEIEPKHYTYRKEKR